MASIGFGLGFGTSDSNVACRCGAVRSVIIVASDTISLGNDTIYAGQTDLIKLDTVAFGESPNQTAIGNETIGGFNPAHNMIQFNVALLANYAAFPEC